MTNLVETGSPEKQKYIINILYCFEKKELINHRLHIQEKINKFPLNLLDAAAQASLPIIFNFCNLCYYYIIIYYATIWLINKII